MKLVSPWTKSVNIFITSVTSTRNFFFFFFFATALYEEACPESTDNPPGLLGSATKWSCTCYFKARIKLNTEPAYEGPSVDTVSKQDKLDLEL